MVFQRALYWIAVGLMLPLLGNHFAMKYDLCPRASAEASHVLAMVQHVLGRGQSFAPLPVEARLASMQAEIVRRQAACVRIEAARARIMALEQIESVRGICPHQRVKIRPVPSEGRI